MLLASPAFSQKFGDDNPTRDWLPIPDGYVWPQVAEKAPEFNPVWKKFSELDESQRNAIQANCWPGEKVPERIEFADVDLNGDGKPEIFVGVPSFSAKGPPGLTAYDILSTKDGMAYRSVGAILGRGGQGVQFLVRKNGWLQIESMRPRSEPGMYSRFLMTFGTEDFQISRHEQHDYNSRKVTIRKSEAEHIVGGNGG